MSEVYRLSAVLEAQNNAGDELASFQTQIAEVEAAMASLGDEEIDIRANGSQALAEGAAVRAGLEGIPDKEIDVSVNSGAATAEIGFVAAQVAALDALDPTIEIRVAYNTVLRALSRVLTELVSIIPRISRGFVQLGTSAVGALTGVSGSLSLARTGALNLARGLSGVGGLLLTLVAGAEVFGSLVGIIATIGQLLFGMVAIAGLFGTAVVAGFGLAAAAGFALYQIMQRDETAFQGLRDAASEFGETFRRSFQEAATEMAGLAKEATEFGTSILPRLGEAATEVVGGIREGFRHLVSDVFPQTKESVDRIFGGLPGVIQNVTETIGAFGAGLTGVLGAAMPVVEDLAGWLADVAKRFSEWATSAGGQEAIKTFFRDVSDAMPAIKEGIGSLVSAVETLDELDIEGLAKGFEELAGWIDDTATNIDKLRDFGDKVAGALNEADRKAGNLATTLNKDLFGGGEKNVNVFDVLGRKIKEAFDGGHPLVLDFFEKLGRKFNEADRAATEWAQKMDQKIKEAFDSAVEGVKNFGIQLGQNLTRGFDAALTPVTTFGSNLRSGITAALALAVEAVAAGVAQIGSTVASGFSSVVSTVTTAMGSFVSTIGSGIARAAFAVGSGIARIVSTVASGFASVVSTAASGIASIVSTVASGFASVVSTVISAVASFVSAIVSGFANAVSAAASGVSGILSAIGALVGGMAEVGANAMAALAAAIYAGASSVISAAVSVAQQAIAAAKNVLGIQSPSREFMEIGFQVVRGLAQSLFENAPLAITEAQRMADQIREAMASLVDDVGGMEVSPQIGSLAFGGASGAAGASGSATAGSGVERAVREEVGRLIKENRKQAEKGARDAVKMAASLMRSDFGKWATDENLYDAAQAEIRRRGGR